MYFLFQSYVMPLFHTPVNLMSTLVKSCNRICRMCVKCSMMLLHRPCVFSYTLINKNLPELRTDEWFTARKKPLNRTYNRISFNFTTLASRSCPVEP